MAKVPIDEDLVCAICIDLVNDARQVTCCGSLFCKSCIEQCQRRCGHAACPNCRSVLLPSNILVDKRSERKSAEHLRNCMYHEDYQCSFIGNRTAILKHQVTCECNPTLCKNEPCRKLFLQESERAQAAANQDLALKKQLVATAWQAPEETLRSAFNLSRVEFFRASDGPVQEYQMAFMWSDTYYICTLSIAHHNVSITCNSAGFARQRDLKAKCVLIHPTDPTLNRSVEIFVPAGGSDADDEEDEDYQSDEGSEAESYVSGEDNNQRDIEVIDCTSDGDEEEEEEEEELEDGDDFDADSGETSATNSDDDEDEVQAVPTYQDLVSGRYARTEGDDDSDEENSDEDSEEDDSQDEEEEEQEEEEVHGEANWMTERGFHIFVKNGKFALGVEASAFA